MVLSNGPQRTAMVTFIKIFTSIKLMFQKHEESHYGGPHPMARPSSGRCASRWSTCNREWSYPSFSFQSESPAIVRFRTGKRTSKLPMGPLTTHQHRPLEPFNGSIVLSSCSKSRATTMLCRLPLSLYPFRYLLYCSFCFIQCLTFHKPCFHFYRLALNYYRWSNFRWVVKLYETEDYGNTEEKWYQILFLSTILNTWFHL